MLALLVRRVWLGLRCVLWLGLRCIALRCVAWLALHCVALRGAGRWRVVCPRAALVGARVGRRPRRGSAETRSARHGHCAQPVGLRVPARHRTVRRSGGCVPAFG